MTIEEICNKYIKVKATGILALHQRPKLDWAFKVVLGKESDVCNGCFLEKYYPLRLPYTCAAQQREDGKNVQFKEISKTMTREEMKKLLPIMQAWVDGKTIQVWTNDTWVDEEYPCFFEELSQFRIKPESKFRPFKTQKECWEEMHKHPDFGWIKDNDVYRPIIKIDKENIYYLEYEFKRTGITYSSFKESLELKFTDGTPFGIKEE